MYALFSYIIGWNVYETKSRANYYPIKIRKKVLDQRVDNVILSKKKILVRHSSPFLSTFFFFVVI